MADAINAPEKEPEMKDDKSSFDPMSEGKDMMNDMKGMKDAKAGDFMPGKAEGMPMALKIIQFLLVISAVFSVIGAISLFSWTPVFAVLNLVTAALSLVIVWGINKKAMWSYWLLLILIAYSIISSLINWNSGAIVALVIDVVMIYYVTKAKSWFVPKNTV